MDPDADGEAFGGTEVVKRFTHVAVASRNPTRDDHMVFTNALAGEEGFCVEYTPRGIFKRSRSTWWVFRLPVDQAHRDASFQQEGDKQALVGFGNTGQILRKDHWRRAIFSAGERPANI